jgi:hypothetical protein
VSFTVVLRGTNEWLATWTVAKHHYHDHDPITLTPLPQGDTHAATERPLKDSHEPVGVDQAHDAARLLVVLADAGDSGWLPPRR